MDLCEDQLDLVASARARRPGALRALALVFDEQLAEQDACLDGAVAARRAVRGSRRRLSERWAGGGRRRSAGRRPQAIEEDERGNPDQRGRPAA